MINHREKAKEYFLSGYNCAQSVFMAFCEETGLDEETAAKLASSFGGGMGRLREVCGAVSGMFMAAGLIKGYSDPGTRRAKQPNTSWSSPWRRNLKPKTAASSAGNCWGWNRKRMHPHRRSAQKNIIRDVPAPNW